MARCHLVYLDLTGLATVSDYVPPVGDAFCFSLATLSVRQLVFSPSQSIPVITAA